MTIKETVQKNDGQPPETTVLDGLVKKRMGTSEPFVTLEGSECRATAMSPDLVIVEGFTRDRKGRLIRDYSGNSEVLLKGEINRAGVSVVNKEDGTVISWHWTRTQDGRGMLKRGLDAAKIRLRNTPR